MTTQPDALLLADALAPATIHALAFCQEAASELRRQHEEVTQLRHGAGVANQTIADLVAENKVLHERHHDDNVEYTRVLGQRDLLVRALKEAMDVCGWPNAEFFYKAHAAIKAAEE